MASESSERAQDPIAIEGFECAKQLVKEKNNEECVELLSLMDRVPGADEMGTSLAHVAVIAENVEIIPELRRLGLSLNEIDEYGDTPLTIATEIGAISAIATLLSNGADASIPNGDGLFITHIACLRNLPDVLFEILKQRPALAFAHDADGWMPTHYACLHANPELFRSLSCSSTHALTFTAGVSQRSVLHLLATCDPIHIAETGPEAFMSEGEHWGARPSTAVATEPQSDANVAPSEESGQADSFAESSLESSGSDLGTPVPTPQGFLDSAEYVVRSLFDAAPGVLCGMFRPDHLKRTPIHYAALSGTREMLILTIQTLLSLPLKKILSDLPAVPAREPGMGFSADVLKALPKQLQDVPHDFACLSRGQKPISGVSPLTGAIITIHNEGDSACETSGTLETSNSGPHIDIIDGDTLMAQPGAVLEGCDGEFSDHAFSDGFAHSSPPSGSDGADARPDTPESDIRNEFASESSDAPSTLEGNSAAALLNEMEKPPSDAHAGILDNFFRPDCDGFTPILFAALTGMNWKVRILANFSSPRTTHPRYGTILHCAIRSLDTRTVAATCDFLRGKNWYKLGPLGSGMVGGTGFDFNVPATPPRTPSGARHNLRRRAADHATDVPAVATSEAIFNLTSLDADGRNPLHLLLSEEIWADANHNEEVIISILDTLVSVGGAHAFVHSMALDSQLPSPLLPETPANRKQSRVEKALWNSMSRVQVADTIDMEHLLSSSAARPAFEWASQLCSTNLCPIHLSVAHPSENVASVSSFYLLHLAAVDDLFCDGITHPAVFAVSLDRLNLALPIIMKAIYDESTTRETKRVPRSEKRKYLDLIADCVNIAVIGKRMRSVQELLTLFSRKAPPPPSIAITCAHYEVWDAFELLINAMPNTHALLRSFLARTGRSPHPTILNLLSSNSLHEPLQMLSDAISLNASPTLRIQLVFFATMHGLNAKEERQLQRRGKMIQNIIDSEILGLLFPSFNDEPKRTQLLSRAGTRQRRRQKKATDREFCDAGLRAILDADQNNSFHYLFATSRGRNSPLFKFKAERRISSFVESARGTGAAVAPQRRFSFGLGRKKDAGSEACMSIPPWLFFSLSNFFQHPIKHKVKSLLDSVLVWFEAMRTLDVKHSKPDELEKVVSTDFRVVSMLKTGATLAELSGFMLCGTLNGRNRNGFLPLHLAVRFAPFAAVGWCLVNGGASEVGQRLDKKYYPKLLELLALCVEREGASSAAPKSLALERSNEESEHSFVFHPLEDRHEGAEVAATPPRRRSSVGLEERTLSSLTRSEGFEAAAICTLLLASGVFTGAVDAGKFMYDDIRAVVEGFSSQFSHALVVLIHHIEHTEKKRSRLLDISPPGVFTFGETSRAFSETCTSCGRKFGIFRKRQICGVCGRFVCSKCSSGGRSVPVLGLTDVRLCTTCDKGIERLPDDRAAAVGAAYLDSDSTFTTEAESPIALSGAGAH